MSYEGYVQLLCPVGHTWNLDCYAFDEVSYNDDELQRQGKSKTNCLCPVCKKPFVWWNGVDQTNCDEHGYIELEIDVPAVICKCDKCGIEHVVEPIRYKIPPPDAREKAADKWEKEQAEIRRQEETTEEAQRKEDENNLELPL